MSVQNISTFTITNSDRFLLDANVWLYIYCPLAVTSEHKISIHEAKENYARLYTQILVSGNRIVVPFIVLSEFVNRWLKLDFERLKKEGKLLPNTDYKQVYRNGEYYEPQISVIRSQIEKIISSNSIIIPDGFLNYSVESIIRLDNGFEMNDLMIFKIAERQSCKIVTHDADFNNFSSHIDIVTASRKMIGI